MQIQAAAPIINMNTKSVLYTVFTANTSSFSEKRRIGRRLRATDAKKPDLILKTLNDAGFAAYYVGGCVRDRLLGRPIHDWDITTSALPQQVMALFPHCIPTGIRHGTVTVLLGGAQAEVTTFRADGAYLDGRHPSEVRFVPRLKEDLSRRDFTVNAMAMDLSGRVTDLFGGRQDLRAGVIRCVGDPETRFREDALRMLRAYRFCAQLGFALEAETAAAICVCAPLAAALSIERIRDELEKALLSPRPQLLREMAAAGLLGPAGIGALPPLDWLASLPASPAVRWSGLKILYPALDPVHLRLPGKLCALIGAAARAYQPEMSRLDLKRCIAAHGWETAGIAAVLSGSAPLLDEIRAAGECVTLRQLAVSGSDFPALHGPQVGSVLNALLQHVLLHPADNTRQALLLLAETLPPQ